MKHPSAVDPPVHAQKLVGIVYSNSAVDMIMSSEFLIFASF